MPLLPGAAPFWPRWRIAVLLTLTQSGATVTIDCPQSAVLLVPVPSGCNDSGDERPGPPRCYWQGGGLPRTRDHSDADTCGGGRKQSIVLGPELEYRPNWGLPILLVGDVEAPTSTWSSGSLEP